METNDENNVPFENADIDPGFTGHQDDKTLTGREDKRENNIDAGMSIKEMRETGEGTEKNREANENSENDALNYQNDREHGAYNPKNI